MLLALVGRPANELIPRGHLPGRGAKDHHGQFDAAGVTDQILHIFPDRTVEAPIMILGEQLPRALPQRRRVRQFKTHRLQPGQGPLDPLGSGEPFGLNPKRRLSARPVDAPLRRRQPDPAAGVQLEQQRPRRHVFETTGLVAPVPKLA